METINADNQTTKQRALWTLRLFLISGLLTAFTIAMLAFDISLVIPHRFQMLLLPFSIIAAFVSSLAGFILGLYERKKNERQALIGIIGNLIIFGLYLVGTILFIYILQQFANTMEY